MKQKLICLTLIAMFAFSVIPMTFAAEAQAVNPMKITQEISPETTPLLSDSAHIIINQSPSDSANTPKVTNARPAPQPKSYKLEIEIDWIEGQAPTQAVLDYMVSYYAKQNIIITYQVAATPIPLTATMVDGVSGVSDTEFWKIESTYNDGPTKAVDANNGKYTMPQKWVLYGTSVQGATTTVGYTYCVGTARDLVAGNYVYIADGAADTWATVNEISQTGAETVLLMHEFGHSIGICIVRNGAEVYCTNSYCVMSYLNALNSGNMNQWHYCSAHWKTKNIDYYVA